MAARFNLKFGKKYMQDGENSVALANLDGSGSANNEVMLCRP